MYTLGRFRQPKGNIVDTNCYSPKTLNHWNYQLAYQAQEGNGPRHYIIIFPPKIQKDACQNQRDWSTTTSKMILLHLSLNWYDH